jgi:DeoR/GlpR family transcriptional regulator of sugar metabolism
MTDPETRSAAERRTRIISALRSAGFIVITDIARTLGVSTMTVRRDLRALESTGQVRLVHGGATLAGSAAGCRVFPDDGNAAGRARVAARAVSLVGRSDTIAVDAGPTAYALARALPDDFAGSVITHSMPVLHLLDERTSPPRTVAPGGELLADRHAFVGPSTEAALSQLRARTFFLSPAAVDVRGTYSRSPAEAGVQRRLVEIADEVVLVVTSDVFTTSAPVRIVPLERLTGLVTDRPPPRHVLSALHQADVTVHVAAD